MSTIFQDVWSFVYRRIPLQCSRSITCTYCRRFIIFVHRVPLQYFGADFEITALIEFWKNSLCGCSWWLPLTIFFYQPRSWERHCWNALGVVPACIFDVNVVWFFFYRISWELKIQSIIVDMHWMFCRFAYFISPTHQTQKSIQSESFRQPPIAAAAAVSWKNKCLFCSFFKDLSP